MTFYNKKKNNVFLFFSLSDFLFPPPVYTKLPPRSELEVGGGNKKKKPF